MPSLILASTSPRRAELLRQLTLNFKVVPSTVAEIHHDQLSVREAAQINAYRKPRSISRKYPDCLVVGADTLVCLDMTLFGKPASLEEAYGMLEQLQGRTHQVVTAVCLMLLRNHRQRVFCESTSVIFRPLDAVQIRRYLTPVDPLDKAGGYAIQAEGHQTIEGISAPSSSEIGLPLQALAMELQSWAGLPVVFNQSLYPMPPKFDSGSQASQFLP